MNRALLACLALLAACTEPQPASTGRLLYVQPAADGEWDDPSAHREIVYTSFGDAVGQAVPGDVIFVPSGTYIDPGNHNLISDLTIQGAGADSTVIELGSLRTAQQSNITIQDLTLRSTTPLSGNGITVTGSGHRIQDVAVEGFRFGVWVLGATDTTVDASEIRGNETGIIVDGGTGTRITNNLVESNVETGMLFINVAVSEAVAHNTVVHNGHGSTDPDRGAGIHYSDSYGPVTGNIVTSNARGLVGPEGDDFAGNLVWGNTENYGGDLAPSPDDVRVDPLFVDPHEQDYHLSLASPAIDAGIGAIGVMPDHDADGDPRPMGFGFDLGRDEVDIAPPAVTLLITEVMSNPINEATMEYVEVYNYGDAAIDLRGLYIDDGDTLDELSTFFSAPYLLQPGDYGLIVDTSYSYNLDAYDIYRGGAGWVMVDTNGKVGNGLTNSDPIRLLDSNGTSLLDSYSFPADPGDGISRERVALDVGDEASNWASSVCAAGNSPGRPSCFAPPVVSSPSTLVITEVLANAETESTGEYVELYNSGDTPIELAGLYIGDENSTDELAGFGGGPTLLPPFSHALIVDPDYDGVYPLPSGTLLMTAASSATLGNGLTPTETIELLDTDGTTVLDAMSFGFDPGDGVSIEKVDYAGGDVANNWAAANASCTTGRTPGAWNAASGGLCSLIQITEVMANALDEDTGEFIELYNAGADPVDLVFAVHFSDGDSEDNVRGFPPPGFELQPGDYAVILDPEYAGEYDIPAGTLTLSVVNTTLGNGLATTDPITLFDPSGTWIHDRFRFPFNPGNGISVERVSTVGGDSADNWVGSPCGGGSSPGLPNCASGSTTSSSLSLVISEVMANALDEDTGEYIEIVNTGTSDVDLGDLVLFDGDASDTLLGMTDPADTILPPDGIAVILDPEYAGEYTIPATALLLVPDDTSIGSGLATNDPIQLLEADGVTVVSSYSHPFNPGNGVSVERTAADALDEAASWVAASSATPGAVGW